MIAVVSARSSVRYRLEQAFIGLQPNVHAFPGLSAFVAADRPATLVVVDLADAATQADPISDLATWRRLHPSGAVVAYFSADGGVAELELLTAFHRDLAAELLVAADLTPGRLRALLEKVNLATAKLYVDVRNRFLDAVAQTGRGLQCERPLLNFLELAPINPSVSQVAMHLHGREESYAPNTAAAKKQRLTRTLRGSHTLHAADLLVLMKVLWWVYLRDLGWAPAAIAEFLHTTPRNWRKHANDRLGLRAKVLEVLPQSVVFAWVAELCVEPYATPPSPRHLIERLVAVTERLRERFNYSAAEALTDLLNARESRRAHARNR